MSPRPKRLPLDNPATLIATWLGIGFVPRAPGTLASLTALPLAWLLANSFGRGAVVTGAFLTFAVGLDAAQRCIRRCADEDPQLVVIDEVAGQLIVLATVPPDLVLYALGFALFRFFDVVKPWPVSWADRSVKGGLGVMLDDVLAAGYAVIVLHAVVWAGRGWL